MLDRESKREKILEGKLREIKIRLRKQQEQQDSKAADLLLRQAEKAAAEEIKTHEELPKVKPSLDQGSVNKLFCFFRFKFFFFLLLVLIESAENEFNQMIEEEIQRRIKEQEAHDQPEKPKRSRSHKKKDGLSDAPVESETDEHHSETPATNGTANEQTNGTSNGHHHENGHNENGTATKHET